MEISQPSAKILVIEQQLFVSSDVQRTVAALAVGHHRLRTLCLVFTILYRLASNDFASTALTIKFRMVSGNMLAEYSLLPKSFLAILT